VGLLDTVNDTFSKITGAAGAAKDTAKAAEATARDQRKLNRIEWAQRERQLLAEKESSIGELEGRFVVGGVDVTKGSALQVLDTQLSEFETQRRNEFAVFRQRQKNTQLQSQISGSAAESQARAQGGQTAVSVGIAGIAALAYFSDRRLKTNIVRIGTTPGGHAWYSFDYIWGESSEGVMAQEVPEAAIVGPGGYLLVDYSKVT